MSKLREMVDCTVVCPVEGWLVVMSPSREEICKHRRRIIQRRRQRSLLLFGALQIQRQDDLKRWINRKMDSWRNGCFRKWMIFQFTPHQTTTLTKKMFFCLEANRSEKKSLPFFLTDFLSCKCRYEMSSLPVWKDHQCTNQWWVGDIHTWPCTWPEKL